MEADKESLDDKLLEINKKLKELEFKENLFRLKWNVLEEETKKLADERQKFDAWRVSEEERLSQITAQNEGSVDREFNTSIFFVGIHYDENSLKKRYRELIKIYHPDNPDGDINTVLEINREYDRLYQKITG
jgi:hypothetical protein